MAATVLSSNRAASTGRAERCPSIRSAVTASAATALSSSFRREAIGLTSSLRALAQRADRRLVRLSDCRALSSAAVARGSSYAASAMIAGWRSSSASVKSRGQRSPSPKASRRRGNRMGIWAKCVVGYKPVLSEPQGKRGRATRRTRPGPTSDTPPVNSWLNNTVVSCTSPSASSTRTGSALGASAPARQQAATSLRKAESPARVFAKASAQASRVNTPAS